MTAAELPDCVAAVAFLSASFPGAIPEETGRAWAHKLCRDGVTVEELSKAVDDLVTRAADRPTYGLLWRCVREAREQRRTRTALPAVQPRRASNLQQVTLASRILAAEVGRARRAGRTEPGDSRWAQLVGLSVAELVELAERAQREHPSSGAWLAPALRAVRSRG